VIVHVTSITAIESDDCTHDKTVDVCCQHAKSDHPQLFHLCVGDILNQNILSHVCVGYIKAGKEKGTILVLPNFIF